MKNRKKALLLCIVCIFTLCLFGCNKSESESYLQFLQGQGITDNSQNHWQNSKFESVQISPNGIFVSEVEDKYDKTLYQVENGKYKKIAEQAYGFLELEGRVYYFNSENKLYCYDIETENTAVVFSVSTDISWISIYNKNILCARRNGIYNKVLELYDLNGKRIKTYFEKRGELDRIVQIGRFVIFLNDLKAEVYDLENGKSHYLIYEDGLSDSFMVSDRGNLYISVSRYTIEGDYNTSKVDSQWNGLWKISLNDMEKDKWELTKISDYSYSKFYCVENKLFDEEFTLIKCEGGNVQVEQNTNNDKVSTLPEWHKKEIVDAEFGKWGSPIVQNDDYYFYATGKGIRRIEKTSNKDEYIVKKKSEKMLLCIDESCLYYVVPEEKCLYSISFSGENNHKLICGNDIKNAELRYPDLLGMHVYNEKIYILLGGLELYLFEDKTRQLKHVASDVRTGSEGFYGNTFYYLNGHEGEFCKVNLSTLEKEVQKDKDDKMCFAGQMLQHNNILYFACKDGNKNTVYRYNKDKDYDTILELQDKSWNFKFICSDQDVYYVYDTGKYAGDEVYLCCMNNKALISDKLKLPEDYSHSLGIFEGSLFYEDEKNNVKTIKITDSIKK